MICTTQLEAELSDTELEIIRKFCAIRASGQPVPHEVKRDLERLFAEAQPRVFGICRKLVGDPERARELCQDSMLIGLRKLDNYRGEGRLSTWLYGIARGEALNAIRRKSETLTDDGVLEMGDPALSVLSSFRREERERVLRQAAASLPELERRAIHLRYVEGIPQDRITEILGLETSSGARGLLQKSRRHLERALRTALEELGHGSSFFDVTRG